MAASGKNSRSNWGAVQPNNALVLQTAPAIILASARMPPYAEFQVSLNVRAQDGPSEIFMGFSISWLATRTENAEQLLKEAELSSTDEGDEWLEAEFSGGYLVNGWYFLHGQSCDSRIISEGSLSAVSSLGLTIACSVEEHVMASSAEGWLNGSRQWRIAHDAQKEMFDLEAVGELPEPFQAIREDLWAQQHAEGGADADVDFVFDIPLAVAQTLTGFKHDIGPSPWAGTGPVALAGQSEPKHNSSTTPC